MPGLRVVAVTAQRPAWARCPRARGRGRAGLSCRRWVAPRRAV